MRRKVTNNYSFWMKTLRKYKNVKQSLANSTDEKLVKRLERKLVLLTKRIFKLHKKWALSVGVAALSLWMSNPVAAQTNIDLQASQRVDSIIGGTFQDVGDFNGDGHEDVIVAKGNTEYLIFGDANGLTTTNVAALNGFNGAVIDVNSRDELNFVDINNDGKDDIAASKYILFGTGSLTNDTLDMTQIGPGDGINLTSSAAYDLGYRVVPLEDINGDGINDLALFDYWMSYYSDHPSYILFGKQDTFPNTINLDSISTGDGLIMWEPGGNYWGRNITSADINGDGVSDILKAADNAQVEVFFGKPNGFPSKDINSWFNHISIPGNGWTIYKDTSTLGLTARIGFSSAGDVNADGFDDIIFTDREDYTTGGNIPGNDDVSVLNIVYGHSNPSGVLWLNNIDGTNGAAIPLSYEWARLGAAGDVNGDGIDDLSISFLDSVSVVLYGNCNGFLHNSTLDSVLANTGGFVIPNPNKLYTHHVSFDYNKDGFNETILSRSVPKPITYFINSISSTGIDTRTTCDSLVWIDGNTYTSSNDTATYFLTNSEGCDSLVALKLTINNSSIATDTKTVCNSYTWIDGTIYYSSNNSAIHTLTSVAGCDSILTLNLTVNEDANTDTSITILQGDSILLGDAYQSTAGVYADTLQTSAGCDSVLNYTLSISVGLGEVIASTDLKLYPNPTKGVLLLDYGQNKFIGEELIISNILGEVIYKKALKEGVAVERIDLTNQPKGIYLVRFSNQFFKIVKSD